MKANNSLFLLTLLFALISENLIYAYESVDSHNGEGLTDEEIRLQENYIHEGYIKRLGEEKCKKEDLEKGCQGQEEPILGKTADGLIQAVTKMYGVFSFVPLNYKNAAGKDKESRDVCAMIPTATEILASTYQNTNDNRLANTPMDESKKQVEILYRAADSHDSRYKAAIFQTAGWGATTGCYAALIAKRGILTGPSSAKQKGNYLVRLGASAGLTAYFAIKLDRAKKSRDAIRDIADDLRNMEGVCNPISEKTCYCAQEETSDDPQYCVPEELIPDNLDLKNPSMLAGCVDSKLKSDPKCHCQNDNSCFDVAFQDLAVGELGSAYMNNEFAPTGQLFRGKASLNNLKSDGLAKLNAAKKLLAGINGIPGVDLNNKQNKTAKALNSLGLPTNLARFIAASPSDPKAEAMMKKFHNNPFDISVSDLKKVKTNKSYRQDRILSYGQANSGNNSNRGRDSDSYAAEEYMRKLQEAQRKKQGGQNNNVQILNFSQQQASEQAMRKAQINGDEKRNIFNIITNRYRQSTWQEFGVFNGIQ